LTRPTTKASDGTTMLSGHAVLDERRRWLAGCSPLI